MKILSIIWKKLVEISQCIVYFFVWSMHFLVFSSFFNIRVEGKENIPKKSRVILAANHQNFFDGFLIVYCMGPSKQVSFLVAKRSLKSFFFEVLATLMGSIVISDNLEDYKHSFKRLNEILLSEGRVAIFPEGNISSHLIPRKFKGGVAKLSIDSKTLVIPIYLNSTYNLRYFKFWLRRPEILIRIGKPVDLYDYAKTYGNNVEKITNYLREKVVDLIDIKRFENITDISSIKNIKANPYKLKKIESSSFEGV